MNQTCFRCSNMCVGWRRYERTWDARKKTVYKTHTRTEFERSPALTHHWRMRNGSEKANRLCVPTASLKIRFSIVHVHSACVGHWCACGHVDVWFCACAVSRLQPMDMLIDTMRMCMYVFSCETEPLWLQWRPSDACLPVNSANRMREI